MPNPYGNLAGFTDPEQEGWQERALARVRERQAKQRKKHNRKNGLNLFFDDGFRILLDEAARRRNISLTGYLRRAAGAFIAHDLGLPLADVLHHTAKPREHMGGPSAVGKKTHDDGAGHGDWVIGHLREL